MAQNTFRLTLQGNPPIQERVLTTSHFVLPYDFGENWLNQDQMQWARMYDAPDSRGYDQSIVEVWPMTIRNPHHTTNGWVVRDGWREFVEEHDLLLGDTLTFRATSAPHAEIAEFEVTVRRNGIMVIN